MGRSRSINFTQADRRFSDRHSTPLPFRHEIRRGSRLSIILTLSSQSESSFYFTMAKSVVKSMKKMTNLRSRQLWPPWPPKYPIFCKMRAISSESKFYRSPASYSRNFLVRINAQTEGRKCRKFQNFDISKLGQRRKGESKCGNNGPSLARSRSLLTSHGRRFLIGLYVKWPLNLHWKIHFCIINRGEGLFLGNQLIYKFLWIRKVFSSVFSWGDLSHQLVKWFKSRPSIHPSIHPSVKHPRAFLHLLGYGHQILWRGSLCESNCGYRNFPRSDEPFGHQGAGCENPSGHDYSQVVNLRRLVLMVQVQNTERHDLVPN